MKRLLLVLLAWLCAGRSPAAGLDERQQKIIGVDRPAHPAFQHSTLPEWETSASGPLRPAPSFGSYYSATNLISVWGGYTLGAQRNGYNDNLFLSLSEPTHELTVLSWLAIHDASGNTTASGAFVVEGSSFQPRGSDVIPSFYYSPNLEPAAPDLLGGSWGWGTNAVSFSGTTSFDYPFPSGDHPLFRYLRMTVTEKRTASQSYLQLSEIKLVDSSGTAFSWPSGATVASTNGHSSSETPAKLIDNSVSTKYCTSNGHPPVDITIDLGYGNSVDVSQYSRWQWYTANDVNGRDPTKFAFSASVDGRNWVVLDVSTNATITTSRRALAYTGNLDVSNYVARLVAWNGGAAGTNAFPRGVYTIAWTNLSSAMTLSVGGESVELAAGSGNRNALPGSGTGFVLSGTGTGSIGISRRKVEPYYSTGRGGPTDTSDAAMKAFNAKIVSTNWCLVAHRVRLDDSVHTNDISIVQRDGSLFRDGVSCELPPDGTRALQTNGWYQFVYQAIGTMSVTYVYEWNRRVYDRWLSDAEIRRAFEDDLRFRDSLGYETYVHSNAIYGTEPARVDLDSVDPLLPSSRNWYRAWLAATNPPAATPGAVAVDALVLPVGISSPIRDQPNALVEVLVAEQPMLKALVQRYRSGLAPTNIPVNLSHDHSRVVGSVANLWWVEGEGVWARLLVSDSAASSHLHPSCEILGLRAQATDAWGTWGDFWLPWQIRAVSLVANPALATPVVRPAPVPASPYPGVVRP